MEDVAQKTHFGNRWRWICGSRRETTEKKGGAQCLCWAEEFPSRVTILLDS